MKNSKRVILLKQIFKRAIVIFINYAMWTLMQMINLIIHPSTRNIHIKNNDQTMIQ